MNLYTSVEMAHARHIVETHGCSSIACLALLGDKDFYFSQRGSLIAYAVLGKVAVVLGDPIGPAEDIARTINGFQSFCDQNGWIAAFCPVGPDYLEYYKQAGLNYFLIGYDAILNLRDFNLQGNARSSYRKRYKRLCKLGYQFVMHKPPLSDALLEKLYQISDRWLKRGCGSEKPFFNGWFEPEYIRHSAVAAIHTPQGEMIAFANLAPEYQLNEITIDLVRFAQAYPTGVMDFFFVALFFWAKEQGYDTFNLGGCELAQVGHDPSDPLIERVIHFLFTYTNWFYRYKGLYDFKRKFQPAWKKKYLVYPGIIHLPAVCLAITCLNAGHGFEARRTKNPIRQAEKLEDVFQQT
jgi:phosphatidylglycerol lysyltransferase